MNTDVANTIMPCRGSAKKRYMGIGYLLRDNFSQ